MKVSSMPCSKCSKLQVNLLRQSKIILKWIVQFYNVDVVYIDMEFIHHPKFPKMWLHVGFFYILFFLRIIQNKVQEIFFFVSKVNDIWSCPKDLAILIKTIDFWSHKKSSQTFFYFSFLNTPVFKGHLHQNEYNYLHTLPWL